MEKRTLQQNKSLWLFYERLAEDLNSSGYDMKRTLKEQVDIPWNKNTVHDFLWVPIQEVMTDKESTAELDRKEVNQVYETLIRHLSEKFGITTAFPSEEDK